jgi:large subunit ribosomal protein L15
MELHSLRPAKGAVKNRKRIARGVGSGHGRTATRGHKGAKSRSGYKQKRGFEGGQMPIQMRLPKMGFKNPNRSAYSPINLDRLQSIAEKYNLNAITPEALVEHGLVHKNDKVKILGTGELSTKLEVKAHAFSSTAQKAIEAAGGTTSVVA